MPVYIKLISLYALICWTMHMMQNIIFPESATTIKEKYSPPRIKEK
jgi:hypothetical protein